MRIGGLGWRGWGRLVSMRAWGSPGSPQSVSSAWRSPPREGRGGSVASGKPAGSFPWRKLRRFCPLALSTGKTMRIRLTASCAALALLAGCSAQHAAKPSAVAPATQAAAARPAADYNLNAVAWSQSAIEHDLIYLQTYRDAQARLPAALKDRSWDALSKEDRAAPLKNQKPAVVLDIDETVLDNS